MVAWRGFVCSGWIGFRDMLNEFIETYGGEDESHYEAAPAAPAAGRAPRARAEPREPREESSSGLSVWLENVRGGVRDACGSGHGCDFSCSSTRCPVVAAHLLPSPTTSRVLASWLSFLVCLCCCGVGGGWCFCCRGRLSGECSCRSR